MVYMMAGGTGIDGTGSRAVGICVVCILECKL